MYSLLLPKGVYYRLVSECECVYTAQPLPFDSTVLYPERIYISKGLEGAHALPPGRAVLVLFGQWPVAGREGEGEGEARRGEGPLRPGVCGFVCGCGCWQCGCVSPRHCLCGRCGLCGAGFVCRPCCWSVWVGWTCVKVGGLPP